LGKTMQVLLAFDVEPANLSRPQTIIIGGLDSRREGEPENSDVFMIARVDLQAGTVRAVSVPRDLYIEIPGFGADKITRAYDFGSKSQSGKFKAGAELMKATVENSFGIAVDNVIVTTFHGFEDLVDAFGGVEVNNPYDLADNEYPTIDYGYTSIFFPAGVQTLDGEQALQFCRTRHQDGDPGRVMRQQLVLRGLLTKATDPQYADALWEIVKENKKTVRTDIGPSKQLAYALAAPDFTNENVAFASLQDYVYDDTAANGMWIYSGMWDQIPGFVQGFLDGTIEVEQFV
jgi:LCP family protein required for cell wall assembly